MQNAVEELKLVELQTVLPYSSLQLGLVLKADSIKQTEWNSELGMQL